MDTLPGFNLLSAGAGSGKTYSLTGRLVELLRAGVRPSGIIATTFTNKAAAELKDRVRVRLLQSGMAEAADDLDRALIGTVHSVGLRLLRRFAFEAGVSPLAEPIADNDQQRLFNESLSQVLTPQRIEHFTLLADRLGFTKKNAGDPHDFRKDIRAVTDVARANNFDQKVLHASKIRSRSTFEAFLPEPLDLPALTWQNRLVVHLEQTIAALENNEADGTKTTQEVKDYLRSTLQQLKWRGELYWHEWVKIAKLKPGAKSRELFEPLREFALSHDRHPQFREDVFAYSDLLFETASDVLGEYDAYKRKRGLLDYTDMEALISRLLRLDSVRNVLQKEIDLLLVDEFQDTSPIQLDIFLQLSRLAKHSVWVGDPKQSIYGFRGADPALMQAIVEQTGGIRPENILPHSWRSRPDIVHAVNAIFTKAFPQYPSEQVALEPKRPDPANAGEALLHWHFLSEKDENKKPGQGWLDHCIARQTAVFLEKKPLVMPKGQSTARAAQPGDVAVLCRSNAACARMAGAFVEAGFKVSVGQAGLLDTHEIRLVLACLKQLVSPHDSLSIAEIRVLSMEASLEALVADRLDYLHRQRQGEAVGRWSADQPLIAALHRLRPQTVDLSASEMLDLTIAELDLRRRIAALGNVGQRLDNLDRLRKYAYEYEDACNRLHSAATLGGFLLWVNELAEAGKDEQGSGATDDAVRILTYHASKGLEYPIVICADLENALRESIWGVNLEPENEGVDLDNILGNRWLRYWVNPYADQLANTHLDKAVKQSPAFARARAAALAEEARLLYVGLTRARDYLVFPTSVKKTSWLNRVFSHGDEGIPVLDPDTAESPFYWPADRAEPIRIDTEKIFMPVDFDPLDVQETSVPFHAEPAGRLAHVAEMVNIAQETPPWAMHYLDLLRSLDALKAAESGGAATGAAVRAVALASFVVTDTEQLARSAALQKAIYGCLPEISHNDISEAAIAIRDACIGMAQPLHTRVGYPVSGIFQARKVACTVDLLLEAEETLHLFRFLPWPEGKKQHKPPTIQEAFPVAWAAWVLGQNRPDKVVQLYLVGISGVYRVQ